MSFSLSTAITACLCVLVVSYLLNSTGRGKNLPPGPRTLPLLGNLHLFPKKNVHFQFLTWAQKYGSIYSLKLGPQTVIVLTSPKAINDVLEKNSALTSDRPSIYFAEEVTHGMNLALTHHGATWKALRRGAQEILTHQACMRHIAIQQAEAAQLAYDLVIKPESFAESIRRYALSVVFSVVYGKRIPRLASRTATDFYQMLHKWLYILAPGAHPPVDMIPILKWIPERLAYWKILCAEVRHIQRKLYFGLLQEVQNRTALGQQNGCFLETAIQNGKKWGLDDEGLSYLGGVLLEGATETTAAFVQTLILLLTVHPEVQQKAQHEMDSVFGMDHIPTIKDIESLPYAQAVILETQRFRSITPINFPHRAVADIEYEGYHIPKGSIIYANAWGIYHNTANFSEPEQFNPDRFLGQKGKECAKIMSLAFGSGRRSCPGIYLAKNSITINTLNLLWGFNFKKPLDASGKEIDLDTLDYATAVSYYPNPFKTIIHPRTPHHAELITLQLRSYTEAFSRFEGLLDEEDVEYLKVLRQTLG